MNLADPFMKYFLENYEKLKIEAKMAKVKEKQFELSFFIFFHKSLDDPPLMLKKCLAF